MMPDTHKIPVTVLVCDSDAADRRRIDHVLRDARVANAVRFVDGGEQCLDYLYRRGAYAGEAGLAPRPGLILLDMEMPLTDGRAVLTIIRGDAQFRDIPVVVIAATLLLDDDLVRSRAWQPVAVTAKPVTFAALLEAMEVFDRIWLQIVELSPGSH